MSLAVDPGLPVEIGTIGKELGKLWEESGDTKTRASLINLAIYTENPDAVPWNTGLIAEIAGEHACRALLIFADPASGKSDARAWISAHCHMAGKGERQICSEQITFELDGEMVHSLPNIVFSHLDSDLPLYFWWQGEFREPLDQKLWSWIDRLIFDSADWQKPVEQLAIARKIATLNSERTILCDLNWTRLLGTRFALAQLFDHSCANARMREIEKVSITTSRRSTGLLLLGWLATQFGWRFQSLLGKEFFLPQSGGHIDFSVTEKPGADIAEVSFQTADVSFGIRREEYSDYFHGYIDGGGFCNTNMVLSAGKSRIEDILLMELSRGGKHPLYAKALCAIEPLLSH